MATPTRKQETDFDPHEFLAAHGQHEKNISDLTERISKIEGHLATPQSLATFLNESAKDSRVLEGVFSKMFCRFMNEDIEVQDSVRRKVEDLDRNFFIKFFRRVGFGVYTLFVAAVAVVGKDLLDWLISLIPHK